MPSKNLPNVQLSEVDENFVSDALKKLRDLSAISGGEAVRNNDDLRNRIQVYFDYCERNGVRPGIETICTALSIHRSTFYRWAKGINCDEERFIICSQAKHIIDGFLEMSSNQGKLNPATAIFLMKNYLGYEDSVTIEARTNQEAEMLPSRSRTAESIAEKYKGSVMPSLPTIED